MVGNRRNVGLDVHARSVVACGLDGQTGESFERRLTPDRGEVAAWIEGLPGPAGDGRRIAWRAGRSCSTG
ncbi:MAG TPA: hypothetical protein VF788_11640 [Pseudonocardiaceae bacterium]